MKEFFFTFGDTQQNAGKFVRIQADSELVAKDHMLKRFKGRYARCLDAHDFYNLTQHLTEIPDIQDSNINLF